MDNNKIKIFTDIMDTKLQAKSIIPSIARGAYRGTVVNGSSVEILGTEDITIGQYTGTITHQAITGSNQTVAITKKPYFSNKLGYDDLSQVPANELDFLMTKAVGALAMDVDTNFVALVSKAVVTVSGNLSTIDAVFTGLATAFDTAEVGANDRAVVVSPTVANTLVQKQGSSLNSEKAADAVYEGYLGKYMGIEIFKSNKIGATLTVDNCIGIDMSALVLAKSYDKVRDVTGDTFFGIAIQGLMVYGIDVVENAAANTSDRIIAFDIDTAA